MRSKKAIKELIATIGIDCYQFIVGKNSLLITTKKDVIDGQIIPVQMSIFKSFEHYNAEMIWAYLWYSNSIKKCCETLGIHYVSLPSLGNTSGNANWISPDAIAASIALEKVASMIQDNSVLLLCSELDPAKCHRTEVAKSLAKITKSTIQHLR